MSKFSLEDDVLSIAHHPHEPQFAISLVTGHVSAYSYSLTDPSERTLLWSTKRHKKACRSLCYSLDGTSLVSVGADRVIKRADARSGKVQQKWLDAHKETINVVKWVNECVFCTGDDDGVIKAWDTRVVDGSVRTYTLHEDYVSDLLPLDEKFILATSGDGTLSVHDLRTTTSSGKPSSTTTITTKKEGTGKEEKSALVKRSDDQEDDLTCCLLLKQDSKKPKVLVGTSSGVGLIFKKGDYGDCNDRVLPPKSGEKRNKRGKGVVDEEIGIECLAKVDENTVLVGGTDGRVRMLRVLPNQYLRVLGDFETGEPVEAIVVSPHGEWVFAVGGTDVFVYSLQEPVLDEKSNKVHDTSTIKKAEKHGDNDEESGDDDSNDESDANDGQDDDDDSEGNQFSDSDSDEPKRKKPKQAKPVMEGKKNTFFDDL